MSQDSHVAVTREGAVGALKLLMIVLAASIFWQAASAVNAQFHAEGLITAPPFVRGAARLLIGMETTARFQQRLWEFWMANHRAVALAAMLVSATLLMARYLAFGRVFDYMYMESEARDRRIYSGFMANVFLTLLHAGLIYGLAFLGQDKHAPLVPVILLALLIFNVLWIGGILLASRPNERHALRGLKYMAITAGAATLLLAWITWAIESVPVTDEFMRGSEMILLGAGIAFIVCIADAVVQGAVYFPKRKPPLPAA